MKNIKVVDYLGKEMEGNWNEKFYSSRIEGTKRIYIDNVEVLIKNEDVEKIGNVEKANKQVIENYFAKLTMEQREEILKYLSINLQKEYKKEENIYTNNFEANSLQFLLVENFKKLEFDTKVKTFTCMKNDYFHQKDLISTGNWHN